MVTISNHSGLKEQKFVFYSCCKSTTEYLHFRNRSHRAFSITSAAGHHDRRKERMEKYSMALRAFSQITNVTCVQISLTKLIHLSITNFKEVWKCNPNMCLWKSQNCFLDDASDHHASVLTSWYFILLHLSLPIFNHLPIFTSLKV